MLSGRCNEVGGSAANSRGEGCSRVDLNSALGTMPHTRAGHLASLCSVSSPRKPDARAPSPPDPWASPLAPAAALPKLQCSASHCSRASLLILLFKSKQADPKEKFQMNFARGTPVTFATCRQVTFRNKCHRPHDMRPDADARWSSRSGSCCKKETSKRQLLQTHQHIPVACSRPQERLCQEKRKALRKSV